MKYLKTNLIKGARVGILSFLICFFVSFVFSLVINIGFLDKLNVLLNGSLSDAPKHSISNYLVITSLFINFSVFNNGAVLDNGGTLHIGLLFFIVLPAIAFFVADRRNNKEKHFNGQDFVVYVTSSILFGLFVYFYSWITKGELLGIKIDFTEPMNLLMTIVMALTIQYFIGFNYNKKMPVGISTSRWLLRVFIAIGFILSVLGIVLVVSKYISSIPLLIAISIVLIPNMAIYAMFMLMGASIEFGDQLQVLMENVGVDISFATLNLPIRVGLIACFFIIVLFAIWKLGKNKFLEELFLLATSFSCISLILAYCTHMNLGFIKNLLDVQFGINYFFAFMVPFVIILLAGFILHIFRLIFHEINN